MFKFSATATAVLVATVLAFAVPSAFAGNASAWVHPGDYAGTVTARGVLTPGGKSADCAIGVTLEAADTARFDLSWTLDNRRSENSFRFVFGDDGAFEMSMLRNGAWNHVSAGKCEGAVCRSSFDIAGGPGGRPLASRLNVEFRGSRLQIDMVTALGPLKETFSYGADRR